jgi:hypothetical protein
MSSDQGTNESGVQPCLKRSEFVVIYENTIRCIDREDNLIHYRLTWALQINVALVALLFVMDKVQAYIRAEPYLLVLSSVGVVFTLTSWSAIKAAQVQLKYLRKSLVSAASCVSKEECFLDHIGVHDRVLDNIIATHTGLPRPYGIQGRGGNLGDHAPSIYCWSIMVVWFGIGVASFVALIRAG